MFHDPMNAIRCGRLLQRISNRCCNRRCEARRDGVAYLLCDVDLPTAPQVVGGEGLEERRLSMRDWVVHSIVGVVGIPLRPTSR